MKYTPIFNDEDNISAAVVLYRKALWDVTLVMDQIVSVTLKVISWRQQSKCVKVIAGSVIYVNNDVSVYQNNMEQ